MILVEPHRDHDWLLHAVDNDSDRHWRSCRSTSNEEKSRIVDLAHGATFSFLGFDFRRVKSRRGVWRPWYTPMQKKRTALLRKLKDIFRRYESQPVDRVVDSDQSDSAGLGALLCRGRLLPMLWLHQRLGGKESAAASDACAEPQRLWLEEVE